MPAISNETVKPTPAIEPTPASESQPIGGPGASDREHEGAHLNGETGTNEREHAEGECGIGRHRDPPPMHR
jgi:hypothetical protein